MRHAIAFTVALGCALAAAPARAELTHFEFQQFFATGSVGSINITGTFTGDLVDGRITNLTDIKLFRNGNAFRGNGSLYTFQFDSRSRSWKDGGYLSLDGSANNIIFIDTDYGGGDSGFFNYFYSVTGIGNAAFQPSYYRYQVPQANQLSVRAVDDIAAVPEPSAWALLVLGFGALGAAMRRRPVMRRRTA